MRRKKTYFSLTLSGSIFLLLMMCWLCVCTPFQYQSVQRYVQSQSSGGNNDRQYPQDEDNNQPNEELAKKTGFAINEEYLHPFSIHSYGDEESAVYKEYAVSIHRLYHGELFCPPPNYC